MNITNLIINNTVYDLDTLCPYDFNVYMSWSKSIIVLYAVGLFIIILIYLHMENRIQKAYKDYDELLNLLSTKE